jgi:hypothetical protein
MKYLVFKGWLGFGDRLEVLKMCVNITMHNNIQIYVDWTDSMWSHGAESFYSYFKFIDIPQLESLDDIPADATYYPKAWTGKIKEPFTEDFFDKNDCKVDLLKLDISSISADVLVVNSVESRTTYCDSTFFSKVFRVIHPKIIEEVKRRQVEYDLKKCVGIHIRGTDRINKRGREIPIQWMVLSASTDPRISRKPMIAVSDDKNSFEIWKRFFPQTKLISNISTEISSNQGNHNLSKDELKATKDSLNIDCLIDFFTLASCATILSTYKDSRFSKEAVRLSHFVDTILP